ncbi:MAG TPA: type II methionyl aminopeptidase [Candidatus Thermoplasmatota archaeon]|jgi:methionyl aminopeptidase|nr:type II methionyl aminopeptidase [Candidatus Thermoplasmatota archaeon]
MARHDHEHDDVKPDLDKVRKAGAIAAKARDHGATLIQEGKLLLEVAEEVEAMIVKEGAKPGFPVNLSIGTDAAHYTPNVNDPKRFAKGDLVKLDVGAHIDGHLGDTAVTIEVGTNRFERMIQASREACNNAVNQAKAGVKLTDIGGTIESTIRGHGFKPISNLTGHSIEVYELHAGVSVPNIPRGHGQFEQDKVYAIEPFATDGAGHIKEGDNGNIWHFVQAKPVRNPHARKALEYLAAEHSELPFAERWLRNAVEDRWIPAAVRFLAQAGCISSYAVLREAGPGYVTQAEHTVIIGPDQAEVTTGGALWPP